MVEAFGGSCAICAYDRCPSALEFHHLDPRQKAFTLGMQNPKSWDSIVEELRKCVMLCCRCHVEYHAGVSTVPADAPRFNEAYAKKEHRDPRGIGMKSPGPCPVCKSPLRAVTEKSKRIPIYCSRTCSDVIRSRVSWNVIDLAEMHRTMSINEISKALNVSWHTVRDRLSTKTMQSLVIKGSQ